MTSTPPPPPPRQAGPLFASNRRTRRHPSQIFDDMDLAAPAISAAAAVAPPQQTPIPDQRIVALNRPRSSTYHASSSAIADTINATRRRRRSRLFNSVSASGGHYSYHVGGLEEDGEAVAPPFSYQPPKKRKLEDYMQPQDGTKQLKLSLTYCDGGTYEGEKYRAGNMMLDDETVYCTERYSCNLVLQHETQQPFTLERLEIKAPPLGFTSPVSEGVIAVTDNDFNPVIERISLYGRMVPLRRSSKRDQRARARYIRNILHGTQDILNDIEDDSGYFDGEMITEFDVLSGVRRSRAPVPGEESDKEEEGEEEEEGGEEERDGDEAAEEETDAEAGEDQILLDSEGEDEHEPSGISSEVLARAAIPWPPFGSRSVPRHIPATDSNDSNPNNPNDCPFDIPGEEETEVDDDILRRMEEDHRQMRRWFSSNSSEERRRRRRRREEEADAEKEYACSEPEGEAGEAYMRFQVHDNKTLIVFNPPRYCKSVVLKLWGQKIDNVDIQSILGYGFFGMRVFPAVEMR